MKQPLKVGDRVAGDWYSLKAGCYVRVRGRLKAIEPKQTLIEMPGSQADAWSCSPMSIRRLKRKERRRVWVCYHQSHPWPRVYDAEAVASCGHGFGPSNIAEFIEVKRK